MIAQARAAHRYEHGLASEAESCVHQRDTHVWVTLQAAKGVQAGARIGTACPHGVCSCRRRAGGRRRAPEGVYDSLRGFGDVRSGELCGLWAEARVCPPIPQLNRGIGSSATNWPVSLIGWT